MIIGVIDVGLSLCWCFRLVVVIEGRVSIYGSGEMFLLFDVVGLRYGDISIRLFIVMLSWVCR